MALFAKKKERKRKSINCDPGIGDHKIIESLQHSEITNQSYHRSKLKTKTIAKSDYEMNSKKIKRNGIDATNTAYKFRVKTYKNVLSFYIVFDRDQFVG